MTEPVPSIPAPSHQPDTSDRSSGPTALQRHRDRGEGVISAAIAVLIIAFLGAAMWVGFNTIWENAEKDIAEQVDSIGG